MCAGCWLNYPVVEVTEDVRSAVRAVATLFEQHPTGGAMHVAVDDWNIDDDAIQWCGDHGGLGRKLDKVERASFDSLRSLTEDQRAAALAVVEGLYEPRTTPMFDVVADHLVRGREERAWTIDHSHVFGVDRDGVGFCSCGVRWADTAGEDALAAWHNHC